MIGDRETLSKLNIIRIEKGIEDKLLQNIAERITKSFGGIIKNINMKTLDTPLLAEMGGIENIDAHLLTTILNQTYLNTHILGITNAELTTNDADEFYGVILGGKNPKNNVAVASIRRLNTPEYDLLMNRITKVSIHEVGHNLGLPDHGKYVSAKDGNLCPMSKGEFNKFGYEGYVKAVIDQRGFNFCKDCKHFLKEIYGHSINLS